MILIGKLQERHLSHFQWLSEFRVTCHSSVWVLSVWPIFLLLHCVIFCSTRSKPMTKAISCHSCGSQVMVLRSQIPLSSRKTVKLAECSSISANIRSNLIFQPPLEKWTVNSIIVCSKTQQCSWLQAMPLLGQLSFMLGNKIQLSLRVPVCVHIALQSSTHSARKCQDVYLTVSVCHVSIQMLQRPHAKGHERYCIIPALLNCCSLRESVPSLPVSCEWVPFCSFHPHF